MCDRCRPEYVELHPNVDPIIFAIHKRELEERALEAAERAEKRSRRIPVGFRAAPERPLGGHSMSLDALTHRG